MRNAGSPRPGRLSHRIGAQRMGRLGDCRQSLSPEPRPSGLQIPHAGHRQRLRLHLPLASLFPLPFAPMRYSQLLVLLLLPFLAVAQVRHSGYESYVLFSLAPLLLPPRRPPGRRQDNPLSPEARRHPIAAALARHNRLHPAPPPRPPPLP